MAGDNTTEEGVNDTAHLYEGKRVSSAPPSRRKAAGRLRSSTEIPKDAVPEVHVPTIIESFYLRIRWSHRCRWVLPAHC